MASNSVLARMAVLISANTAEFNRSLAATQSKLQSFSRNMTKIAGAVGIAFGIREVANFAFEISRLAGEAEGVEAAFSKLPESTRLMQQLKEATGGTVSELDLMKRTVQASNFDISLQSLPKLLEFATLRAQQTGQSVDYLVDSIVTGIGRKSKLILDNLGISAVQLDEKLGGVSIAAASVGQVADAVGQIAGESLGKMGTLSENAATKTQRLSAEWENFRVELGNGANGVGIISEGVDTLTKLLQNLTRFLSSDASAPLFDYLKLITVVPRKTLDAANAALEYANSLNSLQSAVDQFNETFGQKPFAGITSDTEEFNRQLEELGKRAEREGKKVLILRDDFGKTVAVIKPFTQTVTNLTASEDNHIITVQELIDKEKELNQLFLDTDRSDKAKLQNIADEIRETHRLIEELEALKIARLSVTARRSLSNEPIKNSEVSGSKFLSDIGVKDASEQIKEALASVDESLINNKQSLENWGESARIRFQLFLDKQQEVAESFMKNAALAQSMGSLIGDAFGEAIAGQKSFADALKSLIPQVLKLFLAEAIGAIITAGAKQGAKSGNAIVGVAAAAAGAAAIGALFSKVGLSGGGGGSSSISSVTPGSVSKSSRPDQKVEVQGKISGYNIDILNKKEGYRRSRVG